jgi:hypothetical protein
MITPPIVFAEGHDIELFASLDELTAKVEPFVVERGNVTAYDSDGRRIDIRVQKPERSGIASLVEVSGRVTAILAEAEPTHGTQLKSLLVAYLAGVLPKSQELAALERSSIRLLINKIEALQQ